jgi:chromosome partitioning protein
MVFCPFFIPIKIRNKKESKDKGERKMSKIIAVANQKGGVGKTTTTVNLASCLGLLGKKVLLCDADPQGNSTSGLGISKKTVQKSVYEMLVEGEPGKNMVVNTKFRGVSVLPARMNLAGAEVEMVKLLNREFCLKKGLDPLKDSFDYILIDCPPSLGLITINALTACDTVLVPIQCEYYALEGLSQLTSTIKQVKRLYNPTIELEGVLLTMFDARTNLSIQVVDEVKKYLPQKVYRTIIMRNVRLSEAPSFGQPIMEYDKTSKGAQCYMELAEEFLQNNSRKGRK